MNEFDKRNNLESDEIDIIGLISEIWKQKKSLSKFLVVFGSIGIFIAIFSENIYTAKTVLLPQTVDSKMGSLGGLALMAGIDLGGNTNGDDVIPPKLYPKIISSIPFKKELLNSIVTHKEHGKITLKDFYQKYYSPSVLARLKRYTIGLPGIISSGFSEKNDNQSDIDTSKQDIDTSKQGIYTITNQEKKLFKIIDSQILVQVNDKEGFVSVSYSMPEALYAAEMLRQAQELLQEKIIAFKINKLKRDLVFIEKGYNDAKVKFLNKQARLAVFQDKNQGFVYSRSKSKLESLMAEYRLANSIYTQFAKQLESQKIKLKKNTPIFSVIDPVCVPTEKSDPKRFMIFITWLFLGGVFGFVFVFTRNFINRFRNVDSLNE